MQQEAAFMLRALRLAERGRGYVEPNPVVGCVIVKDGQIVGEGFHRRFGAPHAEVEAIRKAGAAARGATAYVTLEPCCHHGKTPPCTDALIQAGVARVVTACRDPFTKVAGRGIRQLRSAGVDVQVGLCRSEAEELNAPFFKCVRTGMPYVIAKWAMTLDGAIATGSGESRWISNEKSREIVHELRGRVDAIIVGVGTAVADDPLLTARDTKPRRIARRVVIDPSLRLPVQSKLGQTAYQAPLTLVAAPGASRSRRRRWEAAGAQVVEIAAQGGVLDLQELLEYLGHDQWSTHVLVEGGGRTLGRFFERGLVDEAIVFVAPRVLGDGSAIRPVVRDMTNGPIALAQAAGLRLVESRKIGNDVMLRYRALK